MKEDVTIDSQKMNREHTLSTQLFTQHSNKPKQPYNNENNTIIFSASSSIG